MKIKSVDDKNITCGDLVNFPEGCKSYEEVLFQETGKVKELHIIHLKQEKTMYILNTDCDKYKQHEKSVYKTLYKNKIYYMSKKPVESIKNRNDLLNFRLDICITYLEPAKRKYKKLPISKDSKL